MTTHPTASINVSSSSMPQASTAQRALSRRARCYRRWPSTLQSTLGPTCLASTCTAATSTPLSSLMCLTRRCCASGARAAGDVHVQSRPRITCSLGPAPRAVSAPHQAFSSGCTRGADDRERARRFQRSARVCQCTIMFRLPRVEPNGRYRADRAYAAVTPVP